MVAVYTRSSVFIASGMYTTNTSVTALYGGNGFRLFANSLVVKGFRGYKPFPVYVDTSHQHTVSITRRVNMIWSDSAYKTSKST